MNSQEEENGGKARGENVGKLVRKLEEYVVRKKGKSRVKKWGKPGVGNVVNQE